MRKFLPVLLAIFTAFITVACKSQGHSINLSFSGAANEEVRLGYYLGQKQYIKSTFTLDASGNYVIKGDVPLDPGLYLLVNSDNKVFDFIIDNDQYFTIENDASFSMESLRFSGSEVNNQLLKFYKEISSVNKDLKEDGSNREEISQLSSSLIESTVNSNPNSLFSKYLELQLKIDVPQDLDDSEQTAYFLLHFFDNADFSAKGLQRGPALEFKLNEFYSYLEQLGFTQSTYSAYLAFLNKVEKYEKLNPDLFQYLIIQTINYFAKSKYLDGEKYYVIIIKEFYETGMADWIENDQLNKIIENSRKLEPLLLGEKAPNIIGTDEGGNRFSLISADYDGYIIIFYEEDCESCFELIVEIESIFQSNILENNIAVLLIGDIDPGWVKNNIDVSVRDNFIILDESKLIGNSLENYNVNVRPLMYGLNSDKVIVVKRTTAENTFNAITNTDYVPLGLKSVYQ